MRKLILAFAAVSAALAVAGPAGAANATISIYGSTFSPKNVTVTAGDTVTWVNRDNANHQVLAKGGQFASAILKPKQKYTHKFQTPGTYAFEDELNPKLTGKVTVKPAPPTLTLAVSQSTVVYGTKVTLTGTISSHAAGQQVTIYYRPYPQPNLIQRTTLLTATGGTFSFIVEPQVLTTYQASWSGAYATPVNVQVQPHLSLGKSGAWVVHVSGGRSFAGRSVQLQRLNVATGQWVTLKKVRLNSKSSARVTLTLPKGVSKLRLTMSVNQAGAGYLGVIGPTITWRQS
jgi:plastocyanin